MIWSEEEFRTANFGDERLNKRIVKLAATLSESSTESIPIACKGWQETKAAYRFFDYPKVTAEKIFSPHIEAAKNRIKNQKRVLLLQDTSELDYSEHCQKEGIGFLNNIYHKGLFIHAMLAVSEDRLPLFRCDSPVAI